MHISTGQLSLIIFDPNLQRLLLGNHVIDVCSGGPTADVDKTIVVIGGEPVVITSPNYPSYYPSSLAAGDCEINLRPPANHRDLKAVVRFLDLEDRESSLGCYDKVILEEPRNAAKSYEYCGNSPLTTGNPETIVAESLQFVMITDSMTNRRGFVVHIEGTYSSFVENPHLIQRDVM